MHHIYARIYPNFILSPPFSHTFSPNNIFLSPVLQHALQSNQWIVNNEMLADNISKQPLQSQPQHMQQAYQPPSSALPSAPPMKTHIKSVAENGAIVVEVTFQRFQQQL